MTHRRVAQESDSSPGAVRYYFRSREDLLAACVNQMESDRFEGAETLLNRVDLPFLTPEQVARRALEIYCGTELDDDAVAGMIWSVVDCSRESPRLSKLLGAHRTAAQNQLGTLLTRCGYGAVDPGLATAVLDGSMLSMTLEHNSDASGAATGRLAEILRLAGQR